MHPACRLCFSLCLFVPPLIVLYRCWPFSPRLLRPLSSSSSLYSPLFFSLSFLSAKRPFLPKRAKNAVIKRRIEFWNEAGAHAGQRANVNENVTTDDGWCKIAASLGSTTPHDALLFVALRDLRRKKREWHLLSVRSYSCKQGISLNRITNWIVSYKYFVIPCNTHTDRVYLRKFVSLSM